MLTKNWVLYKIIDMEKINTKRNVVLLLLSILCLVSMLSISCSKNNSSSDSLSLVLPKDENGEVAAENDFAYLSGYFTAQNIGEDYERMFGSDAKDAALSYLVQGILDYKNDAVEKIDMMGDRVRKTQEDFMAKVEEADKRISEQKLEEAKKFFEENKNKEGVSTTDSGLQYEIITQGDGEKVPETVKSITVNYSMAANTPENVVDQSNDMMFGLDQLIPGVQEGIKLMNVGSKYRFYIPPELGYGSESVGAIEGNSVLIFDVEVVRINDGGETPDTSADASN